MGDTILQHRFDENFRNAYNSILRTLFACVKAPVTDYLNLALLATKLLTFQKKYGPFVFWPQLCNEKNCGHQYSSEKKFDFDIKAGTEVLTSLAATVTAKDFPVAEVNKQAHSVSIEISRRLITSQSENLSVATPSFFQKRNREFEAEISEPQKQENEHHKFQSDLPELQSKLQNQRRVQQLQDEVEALINVRSAVLTVENVNKSFRLPPKIIIVGLKENAEETRILCELTARLYDSLQSLKALLLENHCLISKYHKIIDALPGEVNPSVLQKWFIEVKDIENQIKSLPDDARSRNIVESTLLHIESLESYLMPTPTLKFNLDVDNPFNQPPQDVIRQILNASIIAKYGNIGRFSFNYNSKFLRFVPSDSEKPMRIKLVIEDVSINDEGTPIVKFEGKILCEFEQTGEVYKKLSLSTDNEDLFEFIEGKKVDLDNLTSNINVKDIVTYNYQNNPEYLAVYKNILRALFEIVRGYSGIEDSINSLESQVKIFQNQFGPFVFVDELCTDELYLTENRDVMSPDEITALFEAAKSTVNQALEEILCNLDGNLFSGFSLSGIQSSFATLTIENTVDLYQRCCDAYRQLREQRQQNQANPLAEEYLKVIDQMLGEFPKTGRAEDLEAWLLKKSRSLTRSLAYYQDYNAVSTALTYYLSALHDPTKTSEDHLKSQTDFGLRLLHFEGTHGAFNPPQNFRVNEKHNITPQSLITGQRQFVLDVLDGTKSLITENNIFRTFTRQERSVIQKIYALDLEVQEALAKRNRGYFKLPFDANKLSLADKAFQQLDMAFRYTQGFGEAWKNYLTGEKSTADPQQKANNLRYILDTLIKEKKAPSDIIVCNTQTELEELITLTNKAPALMYDLLLTTLLQHPEKYNQKNGNNPNVMQLLKGALSEDSSNPTKVIITNNLRAEQDEKKQDTKYLRNKLFHTVIFTKELCKDLTEAQIIRMAELDTTGEIAKELLFANGWKYVKSSGKLTYASIPKLISLYRQYKGKDQTKGRMDNTADNELKERLNKLTGWARLKAWFMRSNLHNETMKALSKAKELSESERKDIEYYGDKDLQNTANARRPIVIDLHDENNEAVEAVVTISSPTVRSANSLEGSPSSSAEYSQRYLAMAALTSGALFVNAYYTHVNPNSPLEEQTAKHSDILVAKILLARQDLKLEDLNQYARNQSKERSGVLEERFNADKVIAGLLANEDNDDDDNDKSLPEAITQYGKHASNDILSAYYLDQQTTPSMRASILEDVALCQKLLSTENPDHAKQLMTHGKAIELSGNPAFKAFAKANQNEVYKQLNRLNKIAGLTELHQCFDFLKPKTAATTVLSPKLDVKTDPNVRADSNRPAFIS